MMKDNIISDRIDEAMKRLVSSGKFGNKTVVSLPVVFPSGAHAGVEIQITGEDCFVSDIGQGFNEAQNYGASDFYRHSAKIASERFGTKYDGLNMFVLKTSINKIEAAIVAVANASAIAARDSVERAAIEKTKNTNTELFYRVQNIFGSKQVSKVAELKGNQVSWDAHNVVNINGRFAVFEYVADHPNAISNKFMMFTDLSRSKNVNTILNAVVQDIKKISEKGQLIADVANIVPLNATDNQFQSYAKVA